MSLLTPPPDPHAWAPLLPLHPVCGQQLQQHNAIRVGNTGLLQCQGRAATPWQGSCRMTNPAIQAWITVISMMEDEDSQVRCCLHFLACLLLHECCKPVVLRHVYAMLRHPPCVSSSSLAQLALPGWETTRRAHRVRRKKLELTQHSRNMGARKQALIAKGAVAGVALIYLRLLCWPWNTGWRHVVSPFYFYSCFPMMQQC